MKKILIAILTLIICSTAFAQGGERYMGSIVFNNGKLKEENDSINFSINILVADKAVHHRAGVRFVPVIVAGEKSLELPDILVMGKNKSKTYARLQRVLGKKAKKNFREPLKVLTVGEGDSTLFHYSYAAPYEMWMDEGRLVIYQEMIDYRDNRTFIAQSFDNKVELAPRIPYEVNPNANYVLPAPEKKVRKRQGQAFLDFQSGKSVIIPTYRRNPVELDKIRQMFVEIAADSDVNINGLFIEGYASPEGSYTLNERLSRERAQALKEYILNNFELPLTQDKVKVSWVAEDWDGLETLIRMDDMQYKEEILALIESEEELDRREQKLRQLRGGAPYRKMLNELFPQLRRVEYQVDFTIRDYTGAELKNMTAKDYPMLAQRELFMLATEGAEQSVSDNILLNVIPSMYPSSVTAAVNASAVLIKRGEYISARGLLEKFGEYEEAWNNIGVIYMMEGNLDEAERMFQLALDAGVEEAQHNLSEVSKKRADNVRMERYREREN